MTVRTRIAPSPTGDPHVGTAYVALFNYCFARLHGGQFLLRIEDTDQARSTRESEQMILDALRWTGLTWDEGPDVGGPCGPYRQSERSAIYAEHAQRLLDAGHAFRCFHTADELSEMRRAQMASGVRRGFDSAYRSLDRAESDRRAAAGEPFVVRLNVPREGVCVIPDLLRGEIEIEWSQVDMQILLKSDGLPTYHLANVVDDHLMGITHVLRGEEWISSAPKHLHLYRCFGWEPPVLCHLPLLRNPDKSKLSKRKNPTSILYYQRMGFLPEALINYLGRMAWSMPEGVGDGEKFSLGDMVKHFDLSRVSLGGPVFDQAKLSWLNGRYLREDLSPTEFGDRVAQWALNRDYLERIVPLVQSRVERLSDLGPLAGFFFAGRLDLKADAYTGLKLSGEPLCEALAWSLWRLDALPAWEKAAIEGALRETAEQLGHKLRDFLAPFFLAIAGNARSTPLFDSMEVLGRDLSRARIRDALDLVGGMSGKQEKKWRKAFDAASQAEGPASEEG